jgi:hypothetical protein
MDKFHPEPPFSLKKCRINTFSSCLQVSIIEITGILSAKYSFAIIIKHALYTITLEG